MTAPTPQSAPTAWLTRRRTVLLVLAVLLVACLVIRLFFWGPAIIDPPSPDLTNIDPAVRRSIEDHLKEVRNKPTSGEAWGALGIVLHVHVFTEHAKPCFLQAERLDSGNPRWPYHYGRIHLVSDPSEALPKLQRAVELCANESAGPRLRLAEAYLQLGRHDDAREQFRILLRKEVGHPRAHLGMARVYFHAGNLEQSRVYLRDALAHPSTLKSALTLSAEIHERQGQSAAARQDLARTIDLPEEQDWPDGFVEEALQLRVGEAVRRQRAELLFEMQRHAEALKLGREIVRDYPRSTLSWSWLGRAQMQLGQLPAAEESLQIALKLDPNLTRAILLLGTIRHMQKDRAGAMVYFRRAIETKPDSFTAHYNLGLCLKEEEGERAGALAAFQGAVRCQQYSAPAHAMLGELLLDDNRKEEAAFHLQQAVEIDPNQQHAKKLLEDLRRKPADSNKPS